MDQVSRRSFLTKSSVGAAAAVTVGTVGLPRLAGASASEPDLSPAEVAAVNGTTLVHIKDVSRGEVEILVGERAVRFTDKTLVAKVLRAAR
jgi:hypothetical protein